MKINQNNLPKSKNGRLIPTVTKPKENKVLHISPKEKNNSNTISK